MPANFTKSPWGFVHKMVPIVLQNLQGGLQMYLTLFNFNVIFLLLHNFTNLYLAIVKLISLNCGQNCSLKNPDGSLHAENSLQC